jgi:hypothetical protein
MYIATALILQPHGKYPKRCLQKVAVPACPASMAENLWLLMMVANRNIRLTRETFDVIESLKQGCLWQAARFRNVTFQAGFIPPHFFEIFKRNKLHTEIVS